MAKKVRTDRQTDGQTAFQLYIVEYSKPKPTIIPYKRELKGLLTNVFTSYSLAEERIFVNGPCYPRILAKTVQPLS